jgi:hypothetical protein
MLTASWAISIFIPSFIGELLSGAAMVAHPPPSRMLPSARVRAGGSIREGGANRSLSTVCDGQLVGAGAGIRAPRGFSAGEDEGARHLTLLHHAQPRTLQDGR